MKTIIGDSQNPNELVTRESLLKANSSIIEQIQTRLSAKRFRVQEGDNLKLGYMRVFIQAIQVQNAILKDLELEDIKERLEALENIKTENLAEEQVYNSDFENQEIYAKNN